LTGSSQDRGNGGVIFMGRYEIQVLDSYNNRTYADGMMASVYGEWPPLVNVSRKPGEWQSLDIVFESILPALDNTKTWGLDNLEVRIDMPAAAWSWGFNNAGELGDGTFAWPGDPRPVSGGHRFVSVASGSSHSMGIDTDGRLWAWGFNNVGQVGASQSPVGVRVLVVQARDPEIRHRIVSRSAGRPPAISITVS